MSLIPLSSRRNSWNQYPDSGLQGWDSPRYRATVEKQRLRDSNGERRSFFISPTIGRREKKGERGLLPH